MREHSQETGFSLIEVLASLVIISVLFTLINSYMISSYQQNKELDKMFSSVQLCQSLLDSYKSKGYEDLASEIGSAKTVDIREELCLAATDDIPYSAEIMIDSHPDFADEMLIIKVSVFSPNSRNVTELEGFIKK